VKNTGFCFPKGVQLCTPFRAGLQGCATLRGLFFRFATKPVFLCPYLQAFHKDVQIWAHFFACFEMQLAGCLLLLGSLPNKVHLCANLRFLRRQHQDQRENGIHLHAGEFSPHQRSIISLSKPKHLFLRKRLSFGKKGVAVYEWRANTLPSADFSKTNSKISLPSLYRQRPFVRLP
jgi:hypothetical protein